jgi:hypothetical protein
LWVRINLDCFWKAIKEEIKWSYIKGRKAMAPKRWYVICCSWSCQAAVSQGNMRRSSWALPALCSPGLLTFCQHLSG